MKTYRESVGRTRQLKSVPPTSALQQEHPVVTGREEPRFETVRTDLRIKTIEGTPAKGILLIQEPEDGVTTWKVTHLLLGEPDPTLFLIPSDYTILDETGPFDIK